MTYLPEEIPLLIHAHRTDTIWRQSAKDQPKLKCRRSDSGLWDTALDHRVLRCLLHAGFYGVYRIGHIRLDHHLITTLVESLPVDEDAVSGKDPGNKLDDLIGLCVELLGAAPIQEDFIGSSLKLKWLSDHFRELPHDATDETIYQDFDRIHEFNWGAATLACLHRMLCRATKPNTKEMAGPLVLLQVWTWERLTRIAPSRKSNIANGERAIGEANQQLPPGPRACRWRVPFSHEVISTNVSVIFRDQFDRMLEGRTENEIMTGFPSYCTIGGDIWMARVPLICFDITEWHLPGRVLRKFGWVQGVPDRFDVHLAMVFRDRRGKMAIDWAKEYETFTDDWNNRRNNIIHTKRSNEVLTSSDPYILWFHRQTRLVLSNPSDIAAFGYQGIGGSLKSLVHRVARAYHLADSAHITHDGSDALDAIVEI
ncbi:hypothetical protein ACSBR2_010855 [Camellia fascicularis]